MNNVGVDLTQRHQRPGMAATDAEFTEERGAIASHVGSAIRFSEAKVERMTAVDARVAALPGGESVNQPPEFLKMRGLDDRGLGFCRDPGWHGTILADVRYQVSVVRSPERRFVAD